MLRVFLVGLDRPDGPCLFRRCLTRFLAAAFAVSYHEPGEWIFLLEVIEAGGLIVLVLLRLVGLGSENNSAGRPTLGSDTEDRVLRPKVALECSEKFSLFGVGSLER